MRCNKIFVIKGIKKETCVSPWIMSWRLIKGYCTAGRQPPGI